MKKIAVVTILFDYPEHYTPLFQEKLLRELPKEDYYVIHYNSEKENIKNESYYYKFTYFRIKKFVEFIRQNILNDYEYFVLLDATDVAYVGNIESLPNIMNYYSCKILFGAERNLWPVTEYSHLHETKPINSNYRFLNAGVFCSEPKAFIEHIKNITERKLDGLCDQGNWQIEYLHSSDIELDYDNKLVLNSYLSKDDVIVDNNSVILKTNTPIFVHDNGGYNDETIKIVDFFK